MFEFYYESTNSSGRVSFFAETEAQAKEKAREWAGERTIELIGFIAIN